MEFDFDLLEKVGLLSGEIEDADSLVSAKSKRELVVKFFLCVLERLLDEECERNGPGHLISLLIDSSFLRAVVGLSLEVNFGQTKVTYTARSTHSYERTITSTSPKYSMSVSSQPLIFGV